LEQLINPVPGIQVGGYIENRGVDLYRLAKEKGLEGIIAKRKTSTYRPGKRSLDWLKIKARPQQNSWCAVSPKEKVVANILERCYWAHTETDGCTISVTPVPGLAKKD
jgi:hypothetical protein